MKKTVIIGIVFAAVLLGVLIYSTLSLRQHRVEVCVAFNGQQNCRTASGPTQQEAQRTATDNACATLTQGMAESMACGSQQPVSITWLDQ